MPRPKRSRVAPSRAKAAQRQQSSASPPPVAKPLAAPPPRAPSSDIYDVSDREKERLAEARARKSLNVDSKQANALEASKRRRDKALEKLDDITSTTKPSATSAPDQSPEIEYSRRDSTTLAGTRAPRLTDASGLDLDDDIFGNLDDSLDDSRDDTQSAHQSRSTDTSSFNVAMFRRRPRQSSIVGKDDAPIRPSSRGPNTPSITSHLNLGRFKRRQREPSILGTAQKGSAQRPQSQASNYGSVMGDDDSGPEDESTPMDKTKRLSGVSRQARSSRDSSPTLPTRKRKSLECHSGREKRPALEDEAIHQSIEVPSSPPLASSPRLPMCDVPSTPSQIDPDMAPPASSSSDEGSPVIWPSLDSLAHRVYRKPATAIRVATPETEGGASDMSSPPSLTHSPNFGPARTRAKKKPAPGAPPPKVTTAELTALLPRRRQVSNKRKNHDAFDLESSDETDRGHDEDELSYAADTRTIAARKRRAALAQKGATNRGAQKSSGEKENSAEATDKGQKKKPVVRTYGTRSSDKENEEDQDDEEETDHGDVIELGSEAEDDQPEPPSENTETSQMMEERLGVELKNAAKKFKEVDKWELAFEEVIESSDPLPEGR
ncbi:hypothetical protein QBC47DRAFT_379533 [Echria macrotheca]|uniref:Uncharacterized protein n=1 Tax=Echria macrotheca TaxID=438768 RepID=A0AAJ0BDH7_9PEZI|nr:hypothetical protein QBC47DRAFT_379533 [Echria macrotheca]